MKKYFLTILLPLSLTLNFSHSATSATFTATINTVSDYNIGPIFDFSVPFNAGNKVKIYNLDDFIKNGRENPVIRAKRCRRDESVKI
jgi:hypothetical protein